MNPDKHNFYLPPNPHQETEPEKSEKEILWEQSRLETDKITDGLGLGIDEKIKEAVTALKVHEFSTSQSCEGHIHEGTDEEQKHGVAYPWVEIYAPEPEGWEEDEQKKKTWIEKNIRQQERMKELVDEFYNGRETPSDARLVFHTIGIFGGFRIQSSGAENTRAFPPEKQKEKLELYRKEMNDFTQFLKTKHFSEK